MAPTPDDTFSPNITGAEMLSLLGNLCGIPADQVGGWMILVRSACGAPDCIGLGCEVGPLAILSAAQAEGCEKKDDAYELHMLGEAIEDIAVHWRSAR